MAVGQIERHMQPRQAFSTVVAAALDGLLRDYPEARLQGLPRVQNMVLGTSNELSGIVRDSMGLPEESFRQLSLLDARRIRGSNVFTLLNMKRRGEIPSVNLPKEQVRDFFKAMQEDLYSLSPEEKKEFLTYANANFGSRVQVSIVDIRTMVKVNLEKAERGEVDDIAKTADFNKILLVENKLLSIRAKRILGQDTQEYFDRRREAYTKMLDRISPYISPELRRTISQF